MHQYDGISTEELDDAATNLQLAALQLGPVLAGLCGDNQERANREVRLALDLPPTVLERRARAAQLVINADGLPNPAQVAAVIAAIMNTISSIRATLDRRASGASLQ